MFHIVSNNAGLDFVNTLIVDAGKPVDLLNGFEDLVDWSVAAGLVTSSDGRRMVRKWKGTSAAERVFKNALGLRDSLKQITDEVTRGRLASKPALDAVNDILKRKSGFFEIRKDGDAYSKSFHSEQDDITGLLVPIAESMADLLCFGDLAHVKKCENEACVLYFYDTSKNHRRRWCSMAACGNRAKASAFYRRKTGQG